MQPSAPLVSIITPVYNGREHLAECIESVLNQTYANWHYTILDNCSTDGSLAIARKYAATDPRIRVITNESFLQIIDNHNKAIEQASPESKYCKFVFADDWLYPHCIEEMVQSAEQYPSLGLVSAYTMDGEAVLWYGPPYPALQVSGREVCRSKLMGGQYLFGTMTSLLIRADLIRKRVPFFNNKNLHADQEACFDLLQESNFGFIHQVLSFSRPRPESNGSFAKDFESVILGDFAIFLKYGPVFLNADEYRQGLRMVKRRYHRALAKNLLRLRPKQFWRYHQDTLAAFGGRISSVLLIWSILPEITFRLSQPVQALRYARRWWRAAVSRIVKKSSARTHIPIGPAAEGR